MISLYLFQDKAIARVFDYWRVNPDKHPVIAIPTGAGKSFIIADLIRRVVEAKNINVLVISHRKEILKQNKEKLEVILKQAGCDYKIGLYSAGLGERSVGQITVAGIQSIHRKSELFYNVSLVIIDEAHLIPHNKNTETMYVKFLSKLRNAKCLGLTATPYRLGSGYIVGKDHLFDDIVYDITQGEAFNKLVRQGYLTKLVSKRTKTELDADKANIKMIGGDYSEKELSLKFDREQITDAAVKEIITQGKDYKKWLLFAIDIKHAESIAVRLNELGIPAMPVHSEMEMDRDTVIQAFRDGTLRCLVNVNILTVGIDIPDIDLIGLLRPTKSPSLYVQIVGRGLRVAPGKEHCLVLDFARVVSTLGPVNNIIISKMKKRKGEGGDPIMKECPDCNTLAPPAARICDHCGYKFPFNTRLNAQSDRNAEIVLVDRIAWYNVDEIMYNKHEKKNSPSSMKVTYRCGLNAYSEWICVEHKGYAKHIADNWIRARLPNRDIEDSEIDTVDKVLEKSNKLITPSEIQVKKDCKYPEIVNFKFNISEQ